VCDDAEGAAESAPVVRYRSCNETREASIEVTNDDRVRNARERSGDDSAVFVVLLRRGSHELAWHRTILV